MTYSSFPVESRSSHRLARSLEDKEGEAAGEVLVAVAISSSRNSLCALMLLLLVDMATGAKDASGRHSPCEDTAFLCFLFIIGTVLTILGSSP